MLLLHLRRFAAVLILSIALLYPSARSGADAIETSGDVLQFALPALSLGATVGHRNEETGAIWDRQGTLQFVESAAVSMAVTYGLKYAINTPRPNGGRYSMPSGHSAISFTSAEFLRKRYGWWWGVPAYAAASWVAYSRVEVGAHRPEDVIAGAAIGIVSSYIFTKQYNGWTPTVSADLHSVQLTMSRSW